MEQLCCRSGFSPTWVHAVGLKRDLHVARVGLKPDPHAAYRRD
jgi:hypothetical protein